MQWKATLVIFEYLCPWMQLSLDSGSDVILTSTWGSWLIRFNTLLHAGSMLEVRDMTIKERETRLDEINRLSYWIVDNIEDINLRKQIAQYVIERVQELVGGED
jgi:hypothetical protein